MATLSRPADAAARTVVIALGLGLTGLTLVLTLSPLWLDSVPLVFKIAVVGVALLSAVRPQDGLLVVAGLSAIGLVAGRLVDSPARGSEALVLAFLAGWALHLWCTRPPISTLLGRVYLPTVLFALVVLASLVEQLWFLQFQTDFAGPFLTDLWTHVSRTYLLGPRGFGMVPAAMRLLEGLGLVAATVVFCHGDAELGRRLLRMLVLGGVGAAMVAVMVVAAETVAAGGWPYVAEYFLTRRWTVHIGDINAAGSYFVMVGAAAFGAFRSKPLGWLAAAISLGALWMTHSRTAILGGVVVGTVVLAWVLDPQRTRAPVRRLAAGGAAMVAVVGLLLYLEPAALRLSQISYEGAIRERLLMLEAGARMWSTDPLFGIGIDQFYLWSTHFAAPALHATMPRFDAHNNVVQIGAELGAAGLVCLGMLVGRIAAAAGRRLRDATGDRPPVGLTVGLAAFGVSALGGHPLLVPEVAYPFWIALGLAGGLAGGLGPGARVDLAAGGRTQRRFDVTSPVMIASVAVLLATSLTFRIRSKIDDIDLTRVAHGFHEWEEEGAAVRYRWTGERARFYIPGHAERLVIPFRALLVGPNREGLDVEIAVEGGDVSRVTLTDEAWHHESVTLSPAAATRPRRIDLRIREPWRPSDTIPGNDDTRQLGIKVGQLALTPTPD